MHTFPNLFLRSSLTRPNQCSWSSARRMLAWPLHRPSRHLHMPQVSLSSPNLLVRLVNLLHKLPDPPVNCLSARQAYLLRRLSFGHPPEPFCFSRPIRRSVAGHCPHPTLQGVLSQPFRQGIWKPLLLLKGAASSSLAGRPKATL